MLVSFEELPDDTRIWIYQANRPFTEKELEEIEPRICEFVKGWSTHGTELRTGYAIKYRRFIVLGIDENFAGAGGCTVDDSVYFIKDLEKDYNVDLLDKLNVTFRQGEYIAHKALKDFKQMVKNKAVSPKTIVFNNLVTTKGEFEEAWEIPLIESWHKRLS